MIQLLAKFLKVIDALEDFVIVDAFAGVGEISSMYRLDPRG